MHHWAAPAAPWRAPCPAAAPLQRKGLPQPSARTPAPKLVAARLRRRSGKREPPMLQQQQAAPGSESPGSRQASREQATRLGKLSAALFSGSVHGGGKRCPFLWSNHCWGGYPTAKSRSLGPYSILLPSPSASYAGWRTTSHQPDRRCATTTYGCVGHRSTGYHQPQTACAAIRPKGWADHFELPIPTVSC